MSGQERPMTKLEQALGFTLDEPDMKLGQEEEAELWQTMQKLDQFTAPQPRQGSTERVLAAARSHLPEPKPARFRDVLREARQHSPAKTIGLLALIRPQISIFGRPFWLASLFLLLLASYLTLSPDLGGLLPMLMLAPLTGSLGIVYAFRSTDERVLEVEASTPLTWQQLVLARMTIILGLNVAALSIITLAAWFASPGTSFGLLILSWLTPLLVWASIALNVSLRFGHWLGLGASFGAWGVQLVARVNFPQYDLFSLAASTAGVGLRLGLIAIAACSLALTVKATGGQTSFIQGQIGRG